MTLREPSTARLAAQEHIIAVKQSESAHQPSSVPGQIIGTAVKSEDIKQESEQDERERYKEILGERKKRKTTPSKDDPAQQMTPEPHLYTHAHGHVCSRKDCTPIIVSKRGIIKPNRPSTGHFHISNIPCDRMPKKATKSVNKRQDEDLEPGLEKNLHAENDQHLESTTMIDATDRNPNQAAKSVNAHTANEPLVKQDDVPSQDTGLIPKSVNPQTITVSSSDHAEQDEQNAAAGLLLLQQLANMDLPDAEEDEPLIPLVPTVPNINIELDPPTETEPTKSHTNTATTSTSNADSDDTIIYDQNISPSESSEKPVPSRKGVLTITEVGIRSTPTGTSDPVGPVTSEGKLCCDFCKRSFDTRSEKLQHIKRRHPFQSTKGDDLIEPTTAKDKSDTKSTNQANKTKKTENSSGKDSKPKNKGRSTKKSRSSPKPTTSSNKNATKSINKKKPTHTKALRTHNYSCPGCNRVFEQQSELNAHYKKRHPPVQCTICKKVCATPNTLDRHMYKHKPRNYKCKYCDQSFAFKSELEGHTIVHQGEPGFFCENCDKSFMRYPDLAAHERTHTGDSHKCTIEGCGYSAKDIRYLKIHMKTTHSDKEHYLYSCEICHEKFKFYEQRKRHYNTYH